MTRVRRRICWFLCVALPGFAACRPRPAKLPAPAYEAVELPPWEPPAAEPSAFDEAQLGGEVVPEADPAPEDPAPEDPAPEDLAPEDLAPEDPAPGGPESALAPNDLGAEATIPRGPTAPAESTSPPGASTSP